MSPVRCYNVSCPSCSRFHNMMAGVDLVDVLLPLAKNKRCVILIGSRGLGIVRDTSDWDFTLNANGVCSTVHAWLWRNADKVEAFPTHGMELFKFKSTDRRAAVEVALCASPLAWAIEDAYAAVQGSYGRQDLLDLRESLGKEEFYRTLGIPLFSDYPTILVRRYWKPPGSVCVYIHEA